MQGAASALIAVAVAYQSEQKLRSWLVSLPVGHTSQLALPSELLYDPAAHGVHSRGHGGDSVALNLPIGQGEHEVPSKASPSRHVTVGA